MNDKPKSAQPDVILATPEELRDRIRQLGKSATQKNDPRFVRVREIVASFAAVEGALLPILHEVQHEFGHIPGEIVGEIADGLDLSRAEVHGVITYYSHFRSEPAGHHVLEICRAESCQAMGSEDLWAHACEGLHLTPKGGTTEGREITLDPVYCLGLCAMSPAAMLNGKPHARLSKQRLDKLLLTAGSAA